MELKVANCIVDTKTLNADSTSQTVPLFQFVGTEYIFQIAARVKTAFAGVTYPQVKVGYSDDLSRFLALQNIDRAGDLITGGQPESQRLCKKQMVDHTKTEAAKEVVATFSSEATSFSSLSAGSIEFVVIYAV